MLVGMHHETEIWTTQAEHERLAAEMRAFATRSSTTPGKLVEMSVGYAAPSFGRGPVADSPPGPPPRRALDWRPEFKLQADPDRFALRGRGCDVVIDEASHTEGKR